jgi:hypothetical protein
VLRSRAWLKVPREYRPVFSSRSFADADGFAGVEWRSS